MKFINTDGMAFIGPGSEWFWTALQFIALAITFFAIYRQLRAQRSASLFDQMTSWHREFDDVRFMRGHPLNNRRIEEASRCRRTYDCTRDAR